MLGLRHDVVTMEEGLRTLEVAEAVLDSSRTGTMITL